MQVPLTRGLVQEFRRYCHPRAGDQAKRNKSKLVAIGELQSLSGFAVSSRRVLLGVDQAACSTIALLLQVRQPQQLLAEPTGLT